MRSNLLSRAFVLVMGVYGSAIAAAPSVVGTTAVQQNGKASAGTQRGKDSGYTLHASTKLVVLDVMVKDAHGKPVLGLTKEDFHVTEAKQPQAILNFEVARSRVIEPGVTVHSTRELERDASDTPVNIVVLDEINTRFEEMSKARYFLKQYLVSQPERLAIPTMIVVANLTASEKQHDLKVIADYTQDRKALLNALEHYVPRYPWESESMGIELNRNRTGERFHLVFSTLERIAGAAKSHPGHKNIVWIGAGFPERRLDQITNVSVLYDSMQQCIDMLREARTTLYSVNPASDLAYTRGLDRTSTAMFYDLVEDTGGKANYMYNDVDVQIGQSLQDGEDFYTIAYRPTTNSTASGKLREIEVKVDRPGATVASNKGYALPYQLTQKEIRAQTAFDLLEADTSQMIYSGVGLKVARAGQEGDAFSIEVDPSGVTWTPAENGQQRAELALIASTFDAHGRELKRVSKNVHAVIAEGTIPGQITLPVQFEHDPKAVRVRFVVRVEETKKLGSADLQLKP